MAHFLVLAKKNESECDPVNGFQVIGKVYRKRRNLLKRAHGERKCIYGTHQAEYDQPAPVAESGPIHTCWKIMQIQRHKGREKYESAGKFPNGQRLNFHMAEQLPAQYRKYAGQEGGDQGDDDTGFIVRVKMKYQGTV